ncbi:MAG: ACP S-malonyltransferase [Deltaproteobacteria bacterium]|nr:ACP S-malonyltransferase [Deltaproteobacteria bacterium]
MRKTAVVICPGRGTYTKTELGYLNRHRPRVDNFLSRLDSRLAALGEPTVSALDGAKTFSLKTHTPGEYASTLIYACSAADFMAISQDKIEIVAVTGNSMGWYTTLALGGSLDEAGAFSLIHGMGSMMRGGIIGGQLIYPVVDEDWRYAPERAASLAKALADVQATPGCEAHPSIHFGGYAIIGGNEPALQLLMKALPPVDDNKYPFVLVNHAAFHTPLLNGISERAFATFGTDIFQAPKLPLIDGRGHIWQPYSTDPRELRAYTLGHQVYATYDFSRAVSVALKEFAPDYLILLGPGATSGGAIGQILIENRWLGLENKGDFTRRQAAEPFLVAMGRPDQAPLVV